MIANPASVVLTPYVAHWADDHADHVAWILDCLHRHNTGDWGELGADDIAGNNHALRHHSGGIISRYPVPDELTDPTIDDDAIWIITDDLAAPDAVTSVLWPSEY